MTSGPEQIPSFQMKDCAGVLARILNPLFNTCLQDEAFPTYWKITNICPIYKSTNSFQIDNYRLIS